MLLLMHYNKGRDWQGFYKVKPRIVYYRSFRIMSIFIGAVGCIICLFSRICPIFQISNVTGENIDLLKIFLNLLSARSSFVANEPAIFQIDDTYSVPVSLLFMMFFQLCPVAAIRGQGGNVPPRSHQVGKFSAKVVKPKAEYTIF